MDFSSLSKDELLNKIKEIFLLNKDVSNVLKSFQQAVYSVSFIENKRTVNFVSEQIIDVLGISVEDYIKGGYQAKDVFHPADLDYLLENFAKIRTTPEKNLWRLTYRFFHKIKKEYVWIEEAIHTQFNENGEISLFLGIVSSATEKIEQKHQFNFFFRHVDEFILSVRINPDGTKKIIYMSDNVKKVMGISKGIYKQAVLNEHLRERIHPEDFEKLKGILAEKVKKQKQKFTTEYRMLPMNSTEYIWLNEQMHVKYNEKGKPEFLNIITRNITKEKLHIEKIKVAQEKQDLILNTINEGIYSLNIDRESQKKTYDFISKKAVEILGKNYERNANLPEKEQLSFVHPDDREALLSFIKNIPKSKKKAHTFSYRYKSENSNKYSWYEETIFPQYEDGIIVAFFGHIRDITETKNYELKLKTSETRFKTLVKNSPYGVIIHDLEGYIKYINENALQILGVDKEDPLLKSSINVQDYVLSSFIKKINKQRIQVLRGNTSLPFQEVKIRRPLDRKVVFIEVKLTLIEYDKKKALQVVFKDISTKKKLEQEQIRLTIIEKSNELLKKEIEERKIIEKKLKESEEKYRDIFENTTDLIQTVDNNGNFIYVNNAWKKTLGYSEKDIESLNIIDIIHDDSKLISQQIFSKISHKRTSFKEEFNLLTKAGETIIVQANISYRFKDKTFISSRAILRNITNEKWNEKLEKLYNDVAKVSTKNLPAKQLYEGIRQVIGEVIDTRVFAISYVDEEHVLSFPYFFDESDGGFISIDDTKNKNGLNHHLISIGESVMMYKSDFNKLVNENKVIAYGKPFEVLFGVPLKIKNKIIGFLSVQSYDDKEAFSAKAIEVLQFIAIPIASAVQRKVDENKLYEQSLRLNAVLESSTHLFWSYSNEKGLLSFNHNFCVHMKSVYGFEPKITSPFEKEIVPIFLSDEKKLWKSKYTSAFSGKREHFIVRQSNVDIVLEIFLNPIYNSEGVVTEISGIALDITEKEKTEMQIKESLKEKEILLQEVHHRVKNNLQIISSILNLQSSFIKDEKVLEIIKESQHRIKAMAFIHESLYQNTNFSQINLSEYVVNLSKNLLHSYATDYAKIDLVFNVEDVHLSLDLSIPCGLVVNELVTNAIKYAFNSKERGEIKISVLLDKNDVVSLIIADNGMGIKKDFDIENTDSLGFQLVHSLVNQIDGELEINSDSNGTTFIIKFKR